MDTKEQIIMFLSKTAMSQKQIADTVGCTVGYVSQIASEPETKLVVNEAKALIVADDLIRQARLEKIEDSAMEVLENSLKNNAYLMTPLEAVKVLQVVSNLPTIVDARKRMGAQAQDEAAQGGAAIKITLPATLVNAHISIEVNTNNEIVEIDGRQMISAQTSDLLNHAQGLIAKGTQVKQIGKVVDTLDFELLTEAGGANGIS